MNVKVLSTHPYLYWRPTALALGLAAALGYSAPALPAQETTAAPGVASGTRVNSYDIPGQALGEALIHFGKQSGLQISVDNDLVESKQAPAVSGAMTAPQALSRLLASSGLTYSISGSMASIAARGTATVLPTLRVGDSLIRERTYTTSRTPISGNRLNQELIEIPRSISVVTRGVIEDQQAASEVEVLRNVSGVNRTNDYNGTYQRFILRGIAADNERSYLRDGYHFLHLSDPAWYNIEQVEVIKGPNAIDYGQSTPGGFVNYVSKKPLDQQQYSLELTTGSYDLYRGSVDLTGPLNDDRTLLYRLTAGYENGGNFIDHIDPQRRGLAGSVSWAITPQTTLNLSAEYQHTELLANPWIPVPDPSSLNSADALSIHNFYGDGNAEFDIEETRYSAELLHALSSNWQLRVMVAQDELIRDTYFIQHRGLTADGTETTRRLWRRPNHDHDTETARLDLRGNLSTLGLNHELVIGTDYYRFESTFPAWARTDLAPISVFDPPFTRTAVPAYTPTEFTTETNYARGFFLQDNIDLGSGWGINLGLRRDTLVNKVTAEETSKTSPNASVTFAPGEHSLVYLSYSSSFEPNWSADLVSGRVADPSEGKQFEIGAKRAWFNDRLTTTAALFELRKTNIVVGDPENPSFSVLTGEAEVRGIELEASGEVLPGLSLLSQITLLDAEVTADTDDTVVGNQLAQSVEKTASLWASYQLPGDFSKWRVGGGIFYTGDRVLNDANTLELPSYTTIDTFVSYQLNPQMTVQANIKNVTDKHYYASASGSGSNFRAVNPGEPRVVSLTFNTAF